MSKRNVALELDNYIRRNFDSELVGSDTIYKNKGAFLFQFIYDRKKFEIIIVSEEIFEDEIK